MRMLIRIVFVIFIANRIDCLGSVCDNCCDCLKDKKEEEKKDEEKKDDKNNDEEKEDEKKDEEKKDEKIMEYEEINEEEDNAAESLVNKDWYSGKNKVVLKIFKKKYDNDFPSKYNGDKISIKLDEKGNPKIVYQNLGGKKYAFFEIKTKDEKTVYLYCGDVESSTSKNGIFEGTPHRSISVIACDTENVTDMNSIFHSCTKLKEINFGQNFNTSNVTNMHGMFYECSSLTKLNLNNFDTTKVSDMEFMFYGCSNLKNLDISNFNTLKVTNMGSMFSKCISLENLDISNFNTTKDTIMEWMFFECISLTVLKISDNFYTTNDKYKKNMFIQCDKLLQDTKNKILGENK